jgi:Icc-related predicted phosphoesterase
MASIRILALSDTHGRHNRFRSLPEADVFLHAGDFTRYGAGAEEFALWFHRLPYKLKLLTLGNHEGKDAVAPVAPAHWQQLFGPMLLLDCGVQARVGTQALTVLGVPHGTQLQRVPSGVDIVLSHDPPYKVLDRTHDGGHAGDEHIASLLNESDARVHVFGHVHTQGGEYETRGAITHINAATRAVLFEFSQDSVRVISEPY